MWWPGPSWTRSARRSSFGTAQDRNVDTESLAGFPLGSQSSFGSTEDRNLLAAVMTSPTAQDGDRPPRSAGDRNDSVITKSKLGILLAVAFRGDCG
jgi:hypothetical protein